MPALQTLALSVLAGAFVAFGGMLYTLTVTQSGLSFGLTQLAGGLAFSLGFILVLVAGAELFAANNLIVMAWADGKIKSRALLRNWGLVYAGNLIGALVSAGLFYLSGSLALADGALAEAAVRIASEKVNHPFQEAVVRGILGNTLVCLAGWLCLAARSLTDKVLAVAFPITAFVALGFEHCVADMYLIPIGFVAGWDADLLVAGLELRGFISHLSAVTLGNAIGGPVLVALAYYAIYRIGKAAEESATPPVAVPWHALTLEETATRLKTRREGLTQKEATERIAELGPNRLTPPRRRGSVARFLLQFHDVLIYVLLAAALITALLEHWIDSGVIAAVVLINAIIGFVQEGKAERALESIRAMLAPQAEAVRDGREVALPAEDLVPGDVVLLRPGDKMPADVRLLWTKNLRIDEAMLTGESVPVEKTVEPLPAQTPAGDRTCMAYAGTLVTYGQGKGVVVTTGDATEIGRISAMLSSVETLTTPLLRQIARFGRWLTVVIVLVAAATFGFGVLIHHYPLTEMFLAAVGLAVAAIPEGLPAIMTIALAIGVQRMARRNAIIRRLPAVETLGSVTVICSDKTGTLTRNEMTVRSVVTADAYFEVGGVGYDPHGQFRLKGQELATEDRPELMELGRAALLCNDAELTPVDSGWGLRGDPTEGALVALAMKAGLDQRLERERMPRTDVVPFESQHRFMATLHHDHSGHVFVYLKGAPERVLEMCNAQRGQGDDHPLDVAYWHRRVEEIARRGERTLAVAFKAVPPAQRSLRFEDVEGGLTLLGLLGITDPPREEAIAAVRECHDAGIRVKMITGDHALTATAIAKELGVGRDGEALTGTQIDALDDDDLRSVVLDVDVFARASPEHKLRLVQALQAEKQIVGMTGDGVNDAPALKRADIGIAMGQKGTEVAKEAAEMVLADDNFASIAHAVEEGRTVYDNLKKAITFILPTNGGEAMLVIAAIALGEALPITPVQILWVNMVTTVTLALALAFEPPEHNVMSRPPRNPAEPILSGFLLWRVFFVSLVILVGTFGLYDFFYRQGAAPEHASTIAVNTLVMFEVFYLLNARHLRASVLSREGLFGNRWVLRAIVVVLVLQGLFTYTLPMQLLFGTQNLKAHEWLWIVLMASSVFILVELEKAVLRFFEGRRAERGSRQKPLPVYNGN